MWEVEVVVAVFILTTLLLCHYVGGGEVEILIIRSSIVVCLSWRY